MKNITICAAAFALTVAAARAQDTTSVPVRQGDPEVRQSPEQLQENLLKDMTRIKGEELPAKVKAAVNSADFRGAKTYYKNSKTEEYAVEVKDGAISSFHFFDKNGQPRNKQR
jgi:acyl-CoA thioesterase